MANAPVSTAVDAQHRPYHVAETASSQGNAPHHRIAVVGQDGLKTTDEFQKMASLRNPQQLAMGKPLPVRRLRRLPNLLGRARHGLESVEGMQVDACQMPERPRSL